MAASCMETNPIKNSFHSRFTPLRQESGVALVVVLAVLGMLTVLLVAFVNNVRVERISSNAYTEQLKARMAAQGAVEQAIFQLQTMTSNSSDYITISLINSATNLLTYIYKSASTNLLVSANFANPSAVLNSSNNFNSQGLIFPTGLIPNMPIPWIYYTNSFITNTSQSAQAIRAITRFAYWVDDESSKINLNYAGNTAGAGLTHSRTNIYNVSSIDLTGIPGIDSGKAQSIVGSRSPLYETMASVMRADDSITNAYDLGLRVFGTIYSMDYERQTNGKMRVNINNFATNVVAGLAVTDIFTAITNSYAFHTKYSANGLYQIAANIRDYIDNDSIPTDEDPSDYSGTKYFGRELTPYFNELEFEVKANAFLANFNTDTSTVAGGSNTLVVISNRYYVEMINLYQSNYTFPNNNLITASNLPIVKVQWDNPALADNTNSTVKGVTIDVSGQSVSKYGAAPSGYYVTNIFVQEMRIAIPTNDPGTVTISIQNATTVTNLFSSNAVSRIDYSLVSFPAANPFATFVAGGLPFGPNTYNVHASVASPGDPRINHRTNDWMSGANSAAPTLTLGDSNVTYAPNSSGDGYFDQNSQGSLVSDNGLPFRNGPMLTVGEIGNIFTITNWSTLKLYDDGRSNWNSSAKIPDWALLDLFTVYQGTNTYGKINLNSQRDLLLYPGGTGSVYSAIVGVTLNPSQTLIVPTVTVITINSLATNIIMNAPYYSIGEVGAKATTLTSIGGGTTQDTDERREAVIRALANIATVRGNQFTIWGLGQSINIVQGKTNVVGEAFLQSVVERVPAYNDAGTITNCTYRVKYSRFLTE